MCLFVVTHVDMYFVIYLSVITLCIYILNIQFDKQYAYNVRHSYGKEGKRANYTAYSCTKIIMGNAPGQGDCHGESLGRIGNLYWVNCSKQRLHTK